MAVVDDRLEVDFAALRADPEAHLRRGRAGERLLVVDGDEVVLEIGPPRDRGLPAGTIPPVDPVIPEQGSIPLADAIRALGEPDPGFLDWLLASRREEGADR